jgi:hypothetical protein
MLKKEIIKRLGVTLVWLVVITLLRWHWHWDLIGLWLGGLIGSFLLEVDELLYVFVIYPQELTSMRVKRLLQERRFKDACVLFLDTQEERTKLVFRSALFQSFFYVFCFFVLTSTEGLFGAGLVMAMALQLVREEIVSLFQEGEEVLRQRLFGQIGKEISFRNQKFFVIFMLLVFLGLNLFLI